MKTLTLTVLAFLLASLVTTQAFAQEEGTQTEPEKVERIGDPWPLETCAVAGMKLGSMGEPIIKIHEGREVRFCCAGCIDAFESDPEKFLSKADKKMIENQKPYYPLGYCIIDTPEKLEEDESENDYSIVYNRLFVYCCPPCDKKVRAEPAKYFKQLDEAVIEKQKDDYPLDTCAVSGQPLDSMGGPVDMVVANRLVRLCCKGCSSKVESDPAGILAKIDAAHKKAAPTEAEGE